MGMPRCESCRNNDAALSASCDDLCIKCAIERLESYGERISELEGESESKGERIAELEGESESKGETISELEDKCYVLENDVESLTDDISVLKDQIKELAGNKFRELAMEILAMEISA